MNLEDLDICFNYHTHTKRCNHASDEDDEEYVKEAMKVGIKVLGFSDHCPFIDVEKLIVRMSVDELDEYFNSIDSLREKYKGRCEILKGLECEYYPNHLKELKEYKEKTDYLILGQHFQTVDEKDYLKYCYKFADEEIAKKYTQSLCEGIGTGLFTYVAHPDYYLSSTDDVNDTFIDCAKKILTKAQEKDIPLEINFGNGLKKHNYKQGTHYGYPNRLFWQIAKDYKIRCVVGFDAHSTQSFKDKDKYIKELSKEVDNLGLNIITKPFIKKVVH